MAPVFRLTMAPAREGDALLLSYGDSAQPHHVMIDGGRASTFRWLRPQLAALPPQQRQFELLVVTHVDRDHIEGAMKLLGDDCPVSFADVWFNGYHHLLGGAYEKFGPVQGERLSHRLLAPGRAWNRAFGGGPVIAGGPEVSLPDGLTLQVLGPTPAQLAALVPTWESECKAAGLIPGAAPPEPQPAPKGFEAFGQPDVNALADAPFESDPSAANNTSIVLVAQFAGAKVLLCGDALADPLAGWLRGIAGSQAAARLDAVKVAHHGSRNNTSREVVELLDCPRYLISSNGAYYDHPHGEAIARIIKYGNGPELVFNYRTEWTTPWADLGLQATWGYRTRYPEPGSEGKLADGTVTVDLLDARAVAI